MIVFALFKKGNIVRFVSWLLQLQMVQCIIDIFPFVLRRDNILLNSVCLLALEPESDIVNIANEYVSSFRSNGRSDISFSCAAETPPLITNFP